MPRYDYQCAACGERQEQFFRMADHRPTVECECGGQAAQVFETLPEVCVKGNQREFKLDNMCAPVGWEHGNTDSEKQERRYKALIESTRAEAKKNDKAAIKGGIRHIAKVPRELARMRGNQFGKDYLDPSKQSATEIKSKLKSDGLLFVD